MAKTGSLLTSGETVKNCPVGAPGLHRRSRVLADHWRRRALTPRSTDFEFFHSFRFGFRVAPSLASATERRPMMRIMKVVLPVSLALGTVLLFANSASTIQPKLATEPVSKDPDDPAIWVHPSDPARSLILGTNKTPAPTGALVVFGLDGKIRQTIDGIDRPNNVDVEYGLKLKWEAHRYRSPHGTAAETSARLRHRAGRKRSQRSRSTRTTSFCGPVGRTGSADGCCSL